MILTDELILRYVVMNKWGKYLAGVEIEPIFMNEINQAILFHSHEEAELYIKEMKEKDVNFSDDVRICLVELAVSFIEK
ncbi:hypothetical protein CIRMBP1284_00981 [Enterococcus cecorum]|uniref:Uncharacterized protein n=1 Tax=Enterococcus cecorum TaxID=44008 RepID=A0A1Y4QRR2_9ENTE|nr:hypothetical protein [Enterococcus cecorum]MCJ0578786.1 hypothetical protein [Enterococcus cecorum]MCJ0582917.1 hypothetical protein [Enterococcus cecorum]MCJ0586004.1 hypothetical protein [Enterococcus cecorum]MDZ5549910.1 hypothetical protein [Enterococcus cecorum]MDZ5577057.1 hypothetical protein [Enterococcus cecorum]